MSMFKKAIYICIAAALFAAPFISSAAAASYAVQSCPSLSRSLLIGARGSDVVALQQFLSVQGYLGVSATGYFGVLTKAAVARWQAQNDIAALGSAGSGIFGPLSRAYLRQVCGSSPISESFFASPTSGTAPLSVQFTSTAPQGSNVGTTVNFGDGTSGNLGFVPVCSSCNALGIVSHTYVSAGIYTATLTGDACACPAGGICNCPNMQILGTATVTVNSGSIPPNIQQLNAPGSVSLQQGGIAEIRNESFYFTLQGLSSSSATIQITPVGCWNSFPSDVPPQVVCMIAMMPIPPQTLSVGQTTYNATNYGITLTQMSNGTATFSVSASPVVQ